MKSQTLFVVGKAARNSQAWQLQGVFDNLVGAEDACRDRRYFIGPVQLNETLPARRKLWPGAVYPKAT